MKLSLEHLEVQILPFCFHEKSCWVQSSLVSSVCLFLCLFVPLFVPLTFSDLLHFKLVKKSTKQNLLQTMTRVFHLFLKGQPENENKTKKRKVSFF